MPRPSSESRLPRYEGHLVLDRALLSDSPQTSACTAWSQTWCSLEEGNLLVYRDRTAAIIAPDDPCASIDIRAYACVQIVPTTDKSYSQLLLSTSLSEPSRTSRLFRPRSSMSLNKLSNDAALRETAESDPRLFMASFASTGSTVPLAITNTDLSLSSKVDDKSRPSSRNKSWIKFSSGSRRLHSKISSSNGSLRTTESSSFASGSTTSSVLSISDSIESIDMDSTSASSPRTLFSVHSSSVLDRVLIRVSSPDALHSWLEALSLTIKMHNGTALAPLPMFRQQRRTSTRPSLSNLPGFHTPTSLQTTPALPSAESGTFPLTEEATPKASHKRQASSTSMYSAFLTTQDSTKPGFVGSNLAFSWAQPEAKVTPATAEKQDSNADPPKSPCRSQEPSLSFASQVYAASGLKRVQRDRRHKRSISTASSSFSFSTAGRVPSPRRNSVASAQLLSSEVVDNSEPRHSVAGFTETLFPGQSTRQRADVSADQGQIAKPVSGGTLPLDKHRRSGSILRFGSARILAWRDEFVSSDSSKPEMPVGLGLDVDRQSPLEGNHCGQIDAQAKAKSSKKFQRFRSFRVLPKTRIEDLDGESASSRCYDDSLSCASPSELRYSEDVSMPSGSTLTQSGATKARGMSRTTSLLNLTKSTLSSLRGKSNSRPSVKHRFAGAPEDGSNAEHSHENCERVQTSGGDFSYELVVRDSAERASCSSGLALGTHSEVATGGSAASEEGGLQGGEVMHVDAGETACSSPLQVERILPPEHMIHMFDQLRAVDPDGRSCDWVGRIEYAARRGSLDWTESGTGTRKPELRLAASQTFGHGTASMDSRRVVDHSRKLRSSKSAWDLPTTAPDISPSPAPMLCHSPLPKHHQSPHGIELQSLPAPPRASKRRTHHINPSPPKSPFADITNLASSLSPLPQPKLAPRRRIALP